jgi:sporulation protein YlmC with PRC-barrel domain
MVNFIGLEEHMAHCGLLRNYRFSDSSEAAEDIRGAKLYGVDDEKLGKIEDVIFDHSTGLIRYVVVDTGGWLSSKRFLVPADSLKASVEHEDDFEVGLTTEQIESFPPYNESHLESEQGWSDYEKRYRSKWESGPVMHRMGTDRNITPTTKQMEGSPAGTTTGSATLGWAAGWESGTERSTTTTDRVIPPGTDTVEISNSAVGIGGRWDTFQSRLRQRRKEAAAGCKTCTVGAVSERDSADTLRKAV